MAETKGDFFRKKIKDTIEKEEEKKLPKKDLKNIMEIDKSLKNLKKDFRFPKKGRRMPEDKGPRPAPSSKIPEPKEPRKPGEEKIMTPLAKGGRIGLKAGSKGCKLAMKGKGRAYGKNS